MRLCFHLECQSTIVVRLGSSSAPNGERLHQGIAPRVRLVFQNRTMGCFGFCSDYTSKDTIVIHIFDFTLSSKAFRVYNTRTRRVEENLHIGFLENKPMIEGNGPKWLFDIDSLTQSMNYVPVAAGTITNESAGTQGELNAGTSTQKEEISQDCIVMPIWKDASYFDSPSKDVGNGEPKSAADDQKQVEDGPDNENDEKDKSEDDSSPKEVNAAGQHVNTASPEVNTGRFKLNTVDPSVSTASSNDQDSPKDMFKMGASHTLEATHVEFFSDEDEPEVDLGNILNSYTVPTTPNTRIHKDHPIKNVIGDVKSSVQTRRMTKPTSEQGFLSVVYEQKTHDTLNTCLYACFLSQIEPTSIAKALSDSSWVEAMQEELLQFKLQQGYRQEECIDYEEVFAPMARIEAIRLFLVNASFMGFMVYQMDVKSAFLYGTIEEEVYVTQPPGFKDPDYHDKVYKVVKALYGLHQAPRAWYETLAKYLLDNGFHRGKIDQTLFIKKQKGDILLVQVYVDDIIFGSTKKELCLEFEKLMHDKFQMSSMGELTFFLGLQVKQKEDGIFISQDKYVTDILKKFGFQDVKTTSTPMDIEKPLLKDSDGDDVDVHLYKSMIGSLMYLTSSRPNVMFAGKPKLGLWYPRDSLFDLVAYSNSDYVGASLDRKSTTRGCQFLGCRLISWQCKKQTVVATSSIEVEYVAAASRCGQAKHIEYLMLKASPLKYVKRGRDTKIPQSSGPPVKVGNEAVNKELGDRMERAATTASSLEAEQDSEHCNGNVLIATVDGQENTITEASVRRDLKLANADGISTLPTTEIFEQLALIGTTRTRSRRIGIRIPQSNVLPHVADEAITKEMHDGLGRATTTTFSLEAEQGSGNISKTQTKATPSRLSSPRTSLEGGLGCHFTMGVVLFRLGLKGYLTYLMNHHSEKRKSISSKEEVQLLTLRNEEASLDIEDPSKQGRMIEEIDQDENVNLVKSSKQGEAHEIAEHRMESDVDFSTASPQNDDDELTLAKTLVNIKRSAVKDKGKAIMQESEPPKKIKKREMIQIGHDEELAQKLHAEELAKSIIRQEQEKYDFEKALEFQNQLDKREEVASKSTEVRKNICMYLKNQGGYKLSHFKGMKYEDIRPIFERQSTKEEKEKKKDEESSKQVEEETVKKEDVIPEQVLKERSRKAEGILKRKASKAREDKDKRQKKQDDLEKLMEYVEVISDSKEVISVTPLAVKSLIVGWKSYCKEDVGYYEIHRANGSYKTYIFFSQMLNDFDKEDLIVSYRLFNKKYASIRPGFDDLMLWGDMKVMFEPDSNDAVWKEKS
ncbi:putative ribonuclease H-like domain-containing protein [Tanacetum coccineum]